MAPREKSQLKRLRGSLPDNETESKKPRRSERLSVNDPDKTPVSHKGHLPSPVTHTTEPDANDRHKSPTATPPEGRPSQVNPREETPVQANILSSPPQDTQAFSQYPPETKDSLGKVSPPVPRARDLGLHLVSTRQTSKGRDFILAIMPQYQFYKVPTTARKMTFSELFLDCCHQLRSHNAGIAPFLMDSESPLDGDVGTLSCGVPEPVCLGDLAKLFNGPVQRAPERSVVELLTLQPQPAPTSVAKRQALELLRRVPDATPEDAVTALAVSMTHMIVISIFASKMLWLTSQAELMHEIARLQAQEDKEDSDSEDGNGGVSETLQRRLVLEALLRTLGWIDWNKGSRANAEAMTGQSAIIFRLKDAPWEMSAMLVAMVSCGMPLSASFMALAPQKVMKPDTMFFMRQVDDYAMGRDGAMPRFTLMAMDTDSDIYMNQCISQLWRPEFP
ncbi:hypothetical protein HYQ44_001307, partial [Verticillium longisporum]